MISPEHPALASLPETDFPPECADLYPPDFRYPVGWLPQRERVTDRAVLLEREAWQRPYLVRLDHGELMLDAQHVVAVKRLQRGKPDTSIESAIRWLEWGEVAKDPGMVATFQAEDLVAEAALWSEAGAHEKAIAMIRSVPRPYQETAKALEALTRSLKALARYADALEECEKLTRAEGITEYARELWRIEMAELLLHLNRRAEAEAVLDARREVFESFWPYHGMRAALDLLDGRRDLAEARVRRAGRLDAYHSYKLLWNRHLVPLAGFIRAELLTEDNRPRLYERNVDALRLCHSIHGALVRGAWEEAHELAEVLQPADVTNWSCAEALALAWIGIGEWERLLRVLPALPGGTMDSISLVLETARFFLKQSGDAEAAWPEISSSLDAREEVKAEFAALLRWHGEGRKGPLPPGGEVVLVDVAPKNWGPGDGRDHWVLFHQPRRGLVRQLFIQDRSQYNPMTWSLRAFFPVREEILMSHDEAVDWLERLLDENVAERGSFIGYKWTMHWNGWQLPQHLQPGPRRPLLAEAVRLAEDDPNFYFHNGPARTFGLCASFAEKLVWALRQCLSGGQRRARPRLADWLEPGAL